MTFAATTAAEKHTLTLCVLMNSSICFDRISLRWMIIDIEGAQVKFPN